MSDLRDPGDAWVTAADGGRYWGRFGAAGLLAYDHTLDAILMQHRVTWSDHGDTWGIPGGAINEGETTLDGAIREAQEEAGVPDGAVTPRFTHVLDRGGWAYTTLIADVATSFTPEITDAESHALEWVRVAEVENRPLHPAFAGSWPLLRPLLGSRPTVIVDAANVVGAVPDGWWKDRRGATERLRDRIEDAAASKRGVRAGFIGLPEGHIENLDRAYPDWVFVTEGVARGIANTPNVRVVDAHDFGDDTIVAEAQSAADRGELVTVVTSDTELRARCLAVGTACLRGSRKLISQLEAALGQS